MTTSRNECCTTTTFCSFTVLAAALLIALGVGAGGYFIGNGFMKARGEHSVEVKGLVERQVKADLSVWSLRFVVAGNDLGEVQNTVDAQRNLVIKFFRDQGLAEGEVLPQRTDVTDRLAQEYGGRDSGKVNRFIVYGGVLVRTNNVDVVNTASRKINDLVKAGVLFTNNGREATLSPTYLFTKLNDIKLEMLKEATRNARVAAEQFANDAAVPLGAMVGASQGTFSILPGDPVPYADETTQLMKIVRVVSTVDFALANSR